MWTNGRDTGYVISSWIMSLQTLTVHVIPAKITYEPLPVRIKDPRGIYIPIYIIVISVWMMIYGH